MTKPAWKVALVSLVLLPFALSCSKKSTTGPSGGSGGGGSGTVATVILTTDKQQIKPDGNDQARLQATVKDANGKGVSNVTVRFTSKLGSGVSLVPDSALTDSAGQTVSTLKSTTAGVDTITAAVGSITGRVQINYSNYTLVIDSLAQSVPPGQSTVVRATLKNAGVPVTGRRLAFTVSQAHGSQVGEAPPYISWTTDSAGHARAGYIAGNTTGFDTVTAKDSTLALNAWTIISIGGGTPEDTIPASIIIQSVSSYFLTVHGGGGTEASFIKIQVLNRNGAGIKKAVRVDFTFVQPLGGGEFFAPSSGLTSSTDGTLTTALNTGSKSGTVKFVATVYGTTIRTTPTLVTIRSGPPDPAHFTISANRCILPGRTGFVGDEATITVYLADLWGNPVPTTAVWFYTNQCMIYPGSAVTDETGKCTNTFRTSLPNDSSFATVTAQTRDSAGTMIYKSLRITLYGNLAVFSLAPTNWTIHTRSGPNGIRFTLTAQDDHGIGLPGKYEYAIRPEGWTDPPDEEFGDTDCLPPTLHTFLAADTISVGYEGPGTVTAKWTGLHQTVTAIDSGSIFKN